MPNHRRGSNFWVFAFALGTLTFGVTHAASAESAGVALASGDLALDDTVAAATATPGKQSPQFTAAIELFNAQRWVDAAIALGDVVASATSDDAANRQLAEYDLAIALFRLELYQASFDFFSGIVENRQHLRFVDALPWLAQLLVRLPEPARVSATLLQYEDADIRLAKLTGGELERSLLWYWRGRELYEKREFDAALVNLSNVDGKSPRFVEAQFFRAAAFVSKRRSLPAVAAIRRAEVALDELGNNVSQPQRMRNLARLMLAQILYTSALGRDPETNLVSVDEKHLNAAFALWRLIDLESEYWLEAQHEMAWAYFMAGDYPRALGAIHTIESPYFDEMEYPELSQLKAAIYVANCSNEAAMIVTGRFNGRLDAVTRELNRLLQQYKKRSSDEFYALLLDVKSKQASLLPEAQPVVASVFRDRPFVRRLEYVKAIELEQHRLNRQPALVASRLGERVRAELTGAHRLAVNDLARLAKERYRSFVDENQRRLIDMWRMSLPSILAMNGASADKFARMGPLTKSTERDGFFGRSAVDARNEVQLSTREAVARRELWNAPLLPPRFYPVSGPVSRQAFDIDSNHIAWPFDGEYWRDELGTYQVAIMSTCGGGRGGRRNLL